MIDCYTQTMNLSERTGICMHEKVNIRFSSSLSVRLEGRRGCNCPRWKINGEEAGVGLGYPAALCLPAFLFCFVSSRAAAGVPNDTDISR